MTIQCFATKNPCIYAHVYDLHHNEDAYLEQIHAYTSSAMVWSSVSHTVKARILAALHLCSKHKPFEEILSQCDIIDIEKCLAILDRPRVAKQLKKKIVSIEQHMMIATPDLLKVVALREAEAKASVKPAATKSRKKDSELAKNKQGAKQKRYKLEIHRKNLKTVEWLITNGGNTRGKGTTENEHVYSDSAVQELIASSSVSGALARKVRAWAKLIKPDLLEYIMLEMPATTVWKNVTDLIHFRPTDFQISYFLDDIYKQKSIPEDSFVFSMRKLVITSKEDIGAEFKRVATNHPQIYSAFAFLRLQDSLMQSGDVVIDLASHVSLETFLWYFDDFRKAAPGECDLLMETRLNDEVGRINNSEATTATAEGKAFTYGKLLECILNFRRQNVSEEVLKSLVSIAGHRLAHMKEHFHEKRHNKATAHEDDGLIAVFGDASSSMNLAIEAATIFASMVSACLDGELSFFASDVVKSPHLKPQTVQDTLQVCKKIQASGCTSLAAALWPYYEKRKVISMIVMVTDEEENTGKKSYMFAELLKKYKADVNPDVSLIIVRVGRGDTKFQQSLETNEIKYDVVVIDNIRPDLAKFDALLEQIVTLSDKIAGESDPDASTMAAATVVKEDEDDEFVVL